jgi:8-oxo-dGTP pyrophosphatase MutT (NUDIX family)
VLGAASPLRRRRRIAPLLRLGYRGAWWAIQAWSALVRPRVWGVKCVLRDGGGRVLFVRHTYGDREAWELPGGRAHRREPAAEAARREAREELGADVADWREAGVARLAQRGARLTITALEARWPDGVAPDADPVEIAQVAWHPIDAPPAPLGLVTRAALAALPGG